MSRRILFPTGYATALAEWDTATFGWALFTDSWVQSEPTEVYLSSIVAYELTDASYSRVTLTGPFTDVVLPLYNETAGYVRYHCDPPQFGILVGGEIAASLVLFVDTGSDATSAIVASFPCNYEANGVNPADFTESAAGVLTVGTVCQEPAL